MGSIVNQSLYEILGIKRDASEKEIKAAYRRCAKNTHPDRGGDAEKFQPIAKAYEVLSDPDRRRRYDKNGIIEDRDVLRALGKELCDAVVNGGHKDHLLDPIRELKKLEGRMAENLTMLTEHQEKIEVDNLKLVESGREKELETVLVAFKELLTQVAALAAGVKQDLENCKDLLKQYQVAKEIIGREEEMQPTNWISMTGGSATFGGIT